MSLAEVVKTEPVLQRVPVAMLSRVWPLIGEHIVEVAERSRGRWSAESILQAIVTERWHLWIVWNDGVRAVLATAIYPEMSGMKVCSIMFCSGEGAAGWRHLIAEIEGWARDSGCQIIETTARKGWARHLPEYKLTHIVLEKGL